MPAPPPQPPPMNSNLHNRSRNRKTQVGRSQRCHKARHKPPNDESLTHSLRAICHSRNLLESPSGLRKRRCVLEELGGMLSSWCCTLSTNTPSCASPSLVSFGSYRLGVHTPDADVDCVVLAPPHVTRDDFFHGWVEVLRDCAKVTELHPVASAYTPVIKFQMDGVKIDLLFARIPNHQWLKDHGTTNDEVKPFEVDDDTLLIGLDEASIRSINGVRVAQYLLSTVGKDTTQLEHFRLTLRLVKEWARVHGLYSNVLGFLGGVNWAILVCWICQMNPTSSASELLRAFFQRFSTWNWPTPIRIAAPFSSSIRSDLPVWDPVNNFRDAKHLMPIITPCYPSMNSAYNVGEPQLRRMREEFVRGWKLCKDVASGKKTWNVLFEGSSFFTQHATYLQVDIVSTNEDDFRVWFGLCEARMRLLIVGLESPENGVRAYPFAKFFHRRSHDDTFRYVASFFIALRFADSVQRVDLGSLATDFLQVVNSWEKRLSTMDLIMNVVPQKKLPSFVFEDEEEVDATVETTISEQPYVESRDTDVDDIKVTTRTPASLKKKQPDSTSPSEFISPLKRTRIT